MPSCRESIHGHDGPEKQRLTPGQAIFSYSWAMTALTTLSHRTPHRLAIGEQIGRWIASDRNLANLCASHSLGTIAFHFAAAPADLRVWAATGASARILTNI
jgi:hypothetical protein